ncbi:MAG: Fic family protein [Pirellulaceae bacterium]
MPKRIPDPEFEAIVAAVARYPDGVSAHGLRAALPFTLPTRMLQRRLAQLVAQSRVLAEGRGRGRRYRLPPADITISQSAPAALEVRAFPADFEIYPPLSAEAEAVRRTVSAPLQARTPVGYRQEFLFDYRPNQTFYLPAEMRARLSRMGRVPDGTPPAGTYARKIFNRLLIDLSWNSSRLEGNTYSLLETERLLEIGEVAEGKDAREAQMILNHKAAIELLVDQADEIGFNRYTILNLHGLLADNLLADPRAIGRLRNIDVAIDGSVYIPLSGPQRIEQCFDRFLETASRIEDPLEQSFFAIVHLTYLQAFEDVNKRVARLAANIPLVRDNLCPLSFVDVPVRAFIDGVLGVYELNRLDLLRDVFDWAYQRSCARYSAVRQSLGDPDPFRMRHRLRIGEIVAHVVRSRMDKKAATACIRAQAGEHVAPEERARFIEVIETELTSLHEGNIARYRVRPAEYQSWRLGWR